MQYFLCWCTNKEPNFISWQKQRDDATVNTKSLQMNFSVFLMQNTEASLLSTGFIFPVNVLMLLPSGGHPGSMLKFRWVPLLALQPHLTGEAPAGVRPSSSSESWASSEQDRDVVHAAHYRREMTTWKNSIPVDLTGLTGMEKENPGEQWEHLKHHFSLNLRWNWSVEQVLLKTERVPLKGSCCLLQLQPAEPQLIGVRTVKVTAPAGQLGANHRPWWAGEGPSF